MRHRNLSSAGDREGQLAGRLACFYFCGMNRQPRLTISIRLVNRKSKEVYMDDEVVKIAERTFTRTMRNCSFFADIGVELKKIQFELRGIARRANAVERFIGIPVSQPRESTGEDNQTRLLSSDINLLPWAVLPAEDCGPVCCSLLLF